MPANTDPKRIPILLAKLREYWEKEPQMRLAQVVASLAPANTDPFYVEDAVLLKELDVLLKKGT